MADCFNQDKKSPSHVIYCNEAVCICHSGMSHTEIV